MLHRCSSQFGALALLLISLICHQACKEVIKDKEDLLSKNSVSLFEEVPVSASKISFVNKIVENEASNIFLYEYYYNGGGVSIADINNDGLDDIYFTSNLFGNKLYLNQGHLSFKDITDESGLSASKPWKTGATFADVNNDGFIDLYLCKAGRLSDCRNELYINNGNLTFSERGKEYGLDDNGFSTHATFFDADKDGDLDMYLVNHSPLRTSSLAIQQRARKEKPKEISDQLYRNIEGKRFINVSKSSGIKPYYAFGLSATSSDLNDDGWPDIYVTNDYDEPDLIYINNHDGTFREVVKTSTKHISLFGMGSDIADINNDLKNDIMVVDMTAEDNRRQKQNMASMNPQLFWNHVNQGYHYQYMHNTVQLNQGNTSHGNPIFSEIARFSGVANSDWSWSVLFADFDNDSWKDIAITNGYLRIRDNDFAKKVEHMKKEASYMEKLQLLSSERIKNYAFRNVDGLRFEKIAKKWGLDFEGFSNGAAYADLDNDGDLDYVINNINDTAKIYENKVNDLGPNYYIQFKFEGDESNHFGIGTKVVLETEIGKQIQEVTSSRGFISSVPPKLHFGLGKVKKIDKIEITWPSGKQQVLKDQNVDQLIRLEERNASVPMSKSDKAKSSALFSELKNNRGLDFFHKENDFDDFNKEPLLPHKMSNFGPALAIGDINNDGLDDVFIGGASGFAARLFIQNENGTFSNYTDAEVLADSAFEDVDAVFFDANNDGYQDLYVVSGGNEHPSGSEAYQDRLYLNENGGEFSKVTLPNINAVGSCVRPHDFDKDGLTDLFVGGRVEGQKYPFPGRSYLLKNVGEMKFIDVTDSIAPNLKHAGMITDGVWTDYDLDGYHDLLVAGEWMKPMLWINNKGERLQHSDTLFHEQEGWWFSIDAKDFNNDKFDDYIIGNLGLNYKYKATVTKPFKVFAGDIDKNGNSDIVLGYHNSGGIFPVRGRECSSQQIPEIKNKFKTYEQFAIASLYDVYGEANLNSTLKYSAYTFASVFASHKKDSDLEITPLPSMAQFSSINDMLIDDWNRDGNLDVLIAGNLYSSEVETTRNDASIGLLLLGDGKGGFETMTNEASGVVLDGDVKKLGVIRTRKGVLIMAAKNQGRVQLLELNEQYFLKNTDR